MLPQIETVVNHCLHYPLTVVMTMKLGYLVKETPHHQRTSKLLQQHPHQNVIVKALFEEYYQENEQLTSLTQSF